MLLTAALLGAACSSGLSESEVIALIQEHVTPGPAGEKGPNWPTGTTRPERRLGGHKARLVSVVLKGLKVQQGCKVNKAFKVNLDGKDLRGRQDQQDRRANKVNEARRANRESEGQKAGLHRFQQRGQLRFQRLYLRRFQLLRLVLQRGQLRFQRLYLRRFQLLRLVLQRRQLRSLPRDPVVGNYPSLLISHYYFKTPKLTTGKSVLSVPLRMPRA